MMDVYTELNKNFIISDTICSKVTTLNPPEGNIGLNSQLYFQTGPSPTNLRIAPKTRNVAEASGW